jgi:hypothetical protein
VNIKNPKFLLFVGIVVLSINACLNTSALALVQGEGTLEHQQRGDNWSGEIEVRKYYPGGKESESGSEEHELTGQFSFKVTTGQFPFKVTDGPGISKSVPYIYDGKGKGYFSVSLARDYQFGDNRFVCKQHAEGPVTFNVDSAWTDFDLAQSSLIKDENKTTITLTNGSDIPVIGECFIELIPRNSPPFRTQTDPCQVINHGLCKDRMGELIDTLLFWDEKIPTHKFSSQLVRLIDGATTRSLYDDKYIGQGYVNITIHGPQKTYDYFPE